MKNKCDVCKVELYTMDYNAEEHCIDCLIELLHEENEAVCPSEEAVAVA